VVVVSYLGIHHLSAAERQQLVRLSQVLLRRWRSSGLAIALFLVLGIVIIFAGPWGGYYGWWW
jgi:hypothetical protein